MDGSALILRIAKQVTRFRLRGITADALKEIYESLIDPETRHELGEYYTPNWLTERICRTAIKDPLSMRVVDPACGSGSFLFSAVRHLLDAAKTAGKSNAEAVKLCLSNIFGVDIHPVAVQFARLSYLLALMPAMGKGRGAVSIPVYVGDALQWNIAAPGDELFKATDRRLEIYVPPEGKASKQTLSFPVVLAENALLFDEAIGKMLNLAERNADPEAVFNWLADKKFSLSKNDRKTLSGTCRTLSQLVREGRNHIWGYVTRNMARPVWLAAEENKADVVIGNPPWLSYRYMNKEMNASFKDACKNAGIWVGGKSATASDLSAYFYMRAASLYMRRNGRIAMLLPLAGQVEAQFLRPVLLGESIAPFRLLKPALGVIPWHEGTREILDSTLALNAGFSKLSDYLRKAEDLWDEKGKGTLSYSERLNFQGSLAVQFPPAQIRVVYAGSGTWPAAAIIRSDSVIESKLYYADVNSVAEARYLTAFINSEANAPENSKISIAWAMGGA